MKHLMYVTKSFLALNFIIIIIITMIDMTFDIVINLTISININITIDIPIIIITDTIFLEPIYPNLFVNYIINWVI